MHIGGLLPAADADGVSAPFAECLRRWLQAGDGGKASAQSDVRVFVARAAGHRGPAQGVRWNDKTKGFEDVSWELCETTADAPPEGGYRFEKDFRGCRRLERMRMIVRRGFRVMENYPAREKMPAGKWLCTLWGEKVIATDGKLTVHFWEHPDEDGFHAEVDGGQDTKEGRVLREVLRMGSEGTRGKGAYIVEELPGSKRPEDEASADCSAS